MKTRSSSDRQNSKKHFRQPALVSTAARSYLANRAKRRQPSKPAVVRRLVEAQEFGSGLTQMEQDALLRRQALIEARQGNYIDAIKIFNHLIERYPASATDYNNRGLVYFQSGEVDAALADYNTALHLNPRLDSVYNNRANYYAAQGELLEAIADYDLAIDLNPSNIRAWINQGITFRELQDYDRAIENFDIALCFGQLEAHIYAERGRAYHLRGDWNCAIADYRRALAHLSSQADESISDRSNRLQRKVEILLNDLLSPLQAS